MKIEHKLILVFCFFLLPDAQAKSAELENCVKSVESWVQASFEFNRGASPESADFLRQLERRLKGREPSGLGVELLELREELNALKGQEKKLAYCQSKRNGLRELVSLWRNDARVNREKDKRVVPAPVEKYFDTLEQSLNGGSAEAK